MKEVIAEPTRPCVLIHTKLEGKKDFLKKLKTYVLCAPHLEVGGDGNNAYVVEVSGQQLLVAEKQDRWIAVGASCGFSKLSCGYVGHSDGYTDLSKNRKMDFEFDEAKNGNVALTGELDLSKTQEFTISVAFGETLASAVSCLFQSLGVPYQECRQLFIDQWERAVNGRKPLGKASGDKGRLFDSSYNLLLTAETNFMRERLSRRSPSPGVRRATISKGRVAITWFGPGIWWRAPWGCSRQAARTRLCALSSISPHARKRMAAFPRISG